MKNFTCLILAVLWTTILLGQTYQINEVLKLDPKNVGLIFNGEKVEGHYMFFVSGKKKHDNYVLRILNPELNPIKDIDISVGASLTLLEIVSNGTSIAIKFFDNDETEVLTMLYSLSGELLLSNREKLDNLVEKLSLDGPISPYGKEGLTPVPGVGYMSFTPKKYTKLGYKISLLTEDGKSSTIRTEKDNNRLEVISNAAINDGKAYNIISSVPKALSSKNIKIHLSAVDLKTKKEIYRKEINSSIHIISSKSEGDNISLYGVEFVKDAKMFGEVQALIKLTFDKSGSQLSENKYFWDYNKLLTAKQAKKKNELFPHEIFLDEENNITVIAEMMRVKSLLETKDIHILNFNSKFELVSKKVFPTVEFSGNGGCLANNYLCMKSSPSSYKFLQRNNEDYALTYFNRNDKGRGYYDVLSRTGNEFKHEQIYGNEKGVIRYVYKAKYGYVILFDHNVKKKTVTMNLEKLNF